MKRALALLLASLMALSALPVLAEEPAAADGPPVIIVDGDLSDWAGLWSLATGEGKIATLYAFMTDTHLAIAFQGPDATNIGIYDILLDLDQDSKTGYQVDGSYKNAGADFLIETWTGGPYDLVSDPTGVEWVWQEDDFPIEKGTSNDGTVSELLVPLDILGMPEHIRIGMFVNDADWNRIGYAPETGGDFIEVPYYTKVIGAPITQPIENIALSLAPNLQALGPAAMPGGLIGTLSATGGDGEHYDFAFQPDVSKGRDNDLFVLQGKELKVGGMPLAPGTYKLSLLVTSLIRKEVASLVVNIDPQDPATPITVDIFDGDLGQWYTVAHDAAKQPPNLTQLKARTDGNRLWFYAAAEALGEDWTLFIGNDISQGAKLRDAWPDATPRHKVTSDGRLWSWEESAWADTGKKATLRQTDKGVEGFVMAARLDPLAKAFSLGIMDGRGSALPETSQGMLAITSPNRLFSPAIKADGDNHDWADVPLLTSGTGVVGDTYAARTEDYLYVLTHLSGVTDPMDDRAFSINILVDADGDPTNGYYHDAYPAHSGIDVLVQDWHSTNLELFIYQKPSTEWFSCVYRKPEGIKKEVKDLGDGNYALEYQIPIALLAQNVPELSDDFYLAVDREEDMQPGTSVGTAPQAHLPTSALLKVPKYRTATTGLSYQDDSFLDWDLIGGKAVPSAQAMKDNLFVTRSRDKLYIMQTGTGLTPSFTMDLEGDHGTTWRIQNSRLLDGKGELIRPLFTRLFADYMTVQVNLEDLGHPSSLTLRASLGDEEVLLPATQGFTLQKDAALYYPQEDFTLHNNPYHGWAAWASVNPEDRIIEPFSTAFLDVKWAEFEPEKGRYDFDALERQYRLSYWKEQGVRFLLRFVMDDVIPTQGQRRMDIPAWLYEEMVQENYDGLGVEGAGTFYDEPELLGGGGFSPNYKSPILRERHRLAIQALAEYFDDRTITAFVQVGSLGHWAEMHTWPDGTGEFPNPELVGAYMQDYTEAFTHVKLAARKPYPYASQHNWGLYNDMFGNVGESDTFRDYFFNGCTDMPHATAEEVAASRMPDFWHHSYSGGEFAEGNVRKFIGDSAIAETLRLIRESHSSIIGPCAPTDLLETDDDGYAYEVNNAAMRRQMGYQLSLESLTRVDKTKPGQAIPLQMTWRNRGVSPFYYPWPVQASLLDKEGKAAYTQLLTLDITTLLPGRTGHQETLVLPDTLAPGTYTLSLSVLDMDSLQPALALNMVEGEPLEYPLYEIVVE